MRRTPLFLAVFALQACSTPLLEAPDEDEGFQIDEGTFQLESGREASYCMRLAIPERYGAEPLFITRIDSRLSAYTHHFFMAYEARPGVKEDRPCLGSEPLTYIGTGESERADPHAGVAAKMVFIAAVGEDSYRLPPGYGIHVKSGKGHFLTSHHVVNPTEVTQELYGVFNIYTAKKEDVTNPINILNCLLQHIDVPAKSEASLKATCVAPFDLDLVVLGSHAHQHLTKFEMRFYDGENTVGDPFYTSTTWDSPAIVPLQEPLSLRTGQGITFNCDFKNPGDQPITFGNGEYGEMCAVMSAYAFPKDRPYEVPPSLGTIIFSEGGTMPLFDTTDVEGAF
jgi:hypothetical protein